MPGLGSSARSFVGSADLTKRCLLDRHARNHLEGWWTTYVEFGAERGDCTPRGVLPLILVYKLLSPDGADRTRVRSLLGVLVVDNQLNRITYGEIFDRRPN